MAVTIGATEADRYQRAQLIGSDPRPMSLHIRNSRDSNTNSRVMYAHRDNGNFGLFFIEGVGGTPTMRLYDGAYASANSSAITYDADTWYSFGWTWAADDSVGYFYNGAAQGTATKTVSSGGTNCYIGGSSVGGSYCMAGRFADFAIWNVVLTASEWASLAAGYSPLLVRPQSLVSYVPGVTNTAQDLKIGSWTKNGTQSDYAHPRVFSKRRRMAFSPSAAAASYSSSFFRENAGLGAAGAGPFARANAGLGAIA